MMISDADGSIVLTNAAGGLREGMFVGEPVLISDHLNLTARSPLVGAQFVNLVDAYSPALRTLAQQVDPSLNEGVYAGLPGPHYETPAEIRMLRTLGADLVGMSTVHETIAARAEDAAVLGPGVGLVDLGAVALGLGELEGGGGDAGAGQAVEGGPECGAWADECCAEADQAHPDEGAAGDEDRKGHEVVSFVPGAWGVARKRGEGALRVVERSQYRQPRNIARTMTSMNWPMPCT